MNQGPSPGAVICYQPIRRIPQLSGFYEGRIGFRRAGDRDPKKLASIFDRTGNDEVGDASGFFLLAICWLSVSGEWRAALNSPC